MEKGDVVNVYQDPITKKKPEGRAELLELVSRESKISKHESWKVRFLSDGFVCCRLVG